MGKTPAVADGDGVCPQFEVHEMKRALDILFSAAALLVLSPLLLVVTILLRLTGEGCVFYRQERIGRGGRTFVLYKFATMRKECGRTPEDLLTAQDDPRILPWGRMLRRTKINELPQLFNVLRGDMSLIGPRPQVQPHFDIYPEPVQREIVRVRPGLSGIGSIIFHDESSLVSRCGKDYNRCYAEDIAPYKGKLELWYVQHQSAGLDLLLFCLTILVLLWPEKAYCLQWLKDLPRPDSAVLSGSLVLNESMSSSLLQDSR
jgi:lipopolysaccharide/colanic/teichoic acid biosynthesis glycosyltransferase